MFAAQTIAEIIEVANETDIEPAALLAVAEVESGGRAHALVDRRKEPLIRFEGHYFDRRLAGAKRSAARRAGLASPTAGTIANPTSQPARWRMLARAAAIDREAAYESASWGLGQVMGAHWAWLGYASVDALVAEARSGAAGQARLMARYITKAGLAEALAQKDWARFAHGYNGPNYRRHRYHIRLAAAYRRHSGSGGAGFKTGNPSASLRRGAKGRAVVDLQNLLSAAGYPLESDGRFGPLTEAAVRRFQRDHRLAADGIPGPGTMDALRNALSTGARLRLWWRRLRSLLARLLSRRGV